MISQGKKRAQRADLISANSNSSKKSRRAHRDHNGPMAKSYDITSGAQNIMRPVDDKSELSKGLSPFGRTGFSGQDYDNVDSLEMHNVIVSLSKNRGNSPAWPDPTRGMNLMERQAYVLPDVV